MQDRQHTSTPTALSPSAAGEATATATATAPIRSIRCTRTEKVHCSHHHHHRCRSVTNKLLLQRTRNPMAMLKCTLTLPAVAYRMEQCTLRQTIPQQCCTQQGTVLQVLLLPQAVVQTAVKYLLQHLKLRMSWSIKTYSRMQQTAALVATGVAAAVHTRMLAIHQRASDQMLTVTAHLLHSKMLRCGVFLTLKQFNRCAGRKAAPLLHEHVGSVGSMVHTERASLKDALPTHKPDLNY